MKQYNDVNLFIDCAKAMVGTYTYLYGAKGQIITEKLIQQLASENPSVYTNSYIAKARKKIGRLGLDCSGLFYKLGVCGCIGSYQMRERWKNVPMKDVIPGYAVYKRGHIALCIEVIDADRIKIAEMRGIDYEKSIRITNRSEWLCALVVPNVNYTTKKYGIGWNKDEIGWFYSPDGTNYLKDGFYKLKWSGGENWFVFDKRGYMLENKELRINEDGRVLEV